MSCINPIELKVYDKKTEKFLGYRKVPCGKCVGCLSRRRSSWSFRLYHEFLACQSSWFITLTYDNEHLPLEGVNKRDVQLFLKRLRKKHKLRFYLCAEYGDALGRPHYHGCFFFPEKVDLTQIVNDVSDCWQNGNIQVGEVTLASINYVSKYSLKPRYNEEGIFPNKTFALMSRRPGIGSSFITEKTKAIYKESLEPLVYLDGFTYSMPRYYQDKIYNKLDKLIINQKIKEKYGQQNEKQFRGREWLEAVKAVEQRKFKR